MPSKRGFGSTIIAVGPTVSFDGPEGPRKKPQTRGQSPRMMSGVTWPARSQGSVQHFSRAPVPREKTSDAAAQLRAGRTLPGVLEVNLPDSPQGTQHGFRLLAIGFVC